MLALLQPLAMVAGCLAGWFSPTISEFCGSISDYVILGLVICLFACIPRNQNQGQRSRPQPRIMLIAWIGNFLVIPLIAAIFSSLLWADGMDFRLGLAIYLLNPCTDWFLGYTRLAHGDTATGAALIPLNMLSQLLLYPVWLMLFGGVGHATIFEEILPTFAMWFILPAALGLALRFIPALHRFADHAVPFVLAFLVFSVMANHGAIILKHPGLCLAVLGLVFCFFVTVYQIGKYSFRALKVSYPAEALLTMTTSARNAPMMLGLTLAVLPDRPLVNATIILGMLVEFPHLAVITQLLKNRRVDVEPQKPRPLPAEPGLRRG